MLNTQDMWWARESVACLSLTRDKTTTAVLHAYGASQNKAEHLTLPQARTAFPADSGVILRTGHLGEWTFCHESGEPEGFKDSVLARLSEGTETVLYFSADGMTVVDRFVGGRKAESFEPRNPHTLRSSGPTPLWDAIHRAAPHPSIEQTVQGLENYLSVRIDGAVLTEPLTTVLLRNNQRAPIIAPSPSPEGRSTSPAGLGRSLGTVRPDDLP